MWIILTTKEKFKQPEALLNRPNLLKNNVKIKTLGFITANQIFDIKNNLEQFLVPTISGITSATIVPLL